MRPGTESGTATLRRLQLFGAIVPLSRSDRNASRSVCRLTLKSEASSRGAPQVIALRLLVGAPVPPNPARPAPAQIPHDGGPPEPRR